MTAQPTDSSPRDDHRFLRMQAFEDATCWRTGRLASPCPDCEAIPGDGRCDDHGRDIGLIRAYAQARYAAARCEPATAAPPAS